MSPSSASVLPHDDSACYVVGI
ncbi:hypothetical protein MJO29_009904 [Puccinia striiformis f. sp. tritici]|nr:hypothetical protein MJO29_009904 [Puccinia striiformis f. sp. tritici]